ncbi:MAG: hypothetical protein FD123_96 [Bacteroidetes bacterium]|nr:MAG: hypothetical protein FD123_96 [Bacteroidota bacterium]
MKLPVLVLVLFAAGFLSCRHHVHRNESNGQSITDKYFRSNPRSTSYFKVGKTIYTDKQTGLRTSKVKYARRVACFGGQTLKLVEISYDSLGKRCSRENLLKVNRNDSAEKRSIRTKF